jgi:predicted cobalt transporter CbtA
LEHRIRISLRAPCPRKLSGHFASASLVVHAVMWAIVGVVAGYIWDRGDRTAAA